MARTQKCRQSTSRLLKKVDSRIGRSVIVCMRTFLLRKPMRGKDDRSEILFSYIRLDERIPADHPLRVTRQLVDAALAELSRIEADPAPILRESQSRSVKFLRSS